MYEKLERKNYFWTKTVFWETKAIWGALEDNFGYNLSSCISTENGNDKVIVNKKLERKNAIFGQNIDILRSQSNMRSTRAYFWELLEQLHLGLKWFWKSHCEQKVRAEKRDFWRLNRFSEEPKQFEEHIKIFVETLWAVGSRPQNGIDKVMVYEKLEPKNAIFGRKSDFLRSQRNLRSTWGYFLNLLEQLHLDFISIWQNHRE